jgi:hypothetical protein
MSERFPFITDISDRPAELTPDQRRQAAAIFLGTAQQLLFQYEGGQEQNTASNHHGAVALHLHSQQNGELIIIDAQRVVDGTVDDASIGLIGLANNRATENHQYTSHDDGAVIRMEFNASGAPERPMWVTPEEVDGMNLHFMRNVEDGLYLSVNTAHALQLQGMNL